MSLQGRRVLVTGGGTFEPWDDVRGHTNLSTGSFATIFCRAALGRGMSVRYLHGVFARRPEPAPGLELVEFRGADDLLEKVREGCAAFAPDAVVMAAAVADWALDEVRDRRTGEVLPRGGKIPGSIEPVLLLRHTPKILPRIKAFRPGAFVVGFKLEATSDPDELERRARARMTGPGAPDAMVANEAASLVRHDVTHYLITPGGGRRALPGKQAAADGLLDLLDERLGREAGGGVT